METVCVFLSNNMKTSNIFKVGWESEVNWKSSQQQKLEWSDQENKAVLDYDQNIHESLLL